MTVILEFDEIVALLDMLKLDHLTAGGSAPGAAAGYRLHLARPCQDCLSVTVERRTTGTGELWHWHYHRHQTGALLLLNTHKAETTQ